MSDSDSARIERVFYEFRAIRERTEKMPVLLRSGGRTSVGWPKKANGGAGSAHFVRPALSKRFLYLASKLCRDFPRQLYRSVRKAGLKPVPMEKRTARRRRVFKSALIEFPGGAFSCVIRNFSDLGANLDVPSASGIPHEFTLIIPSAQSQLSCRAVWRSEGRIGVAFS
ncbi:hypothetical protein [Bradyrhizobium sp. BWC-3-1]|uniref:hypothetical protein n=1 Tax=Bradyrhizobium sp. BWC-3-1 TaxID=3080012 RepID=UPI00397BF2D7